MLRQWRMSHYSFPPINGRRSDQPSDDHRESNVRKQPPSVNIECDPNCTLRPSIQPSSASLCVKAERKAFASRLLSSNPINTPTRRTRSACCANAANGQAAAPPSTPDEFAPSHRHPLKLLWAVYRGRGGMGTGRTPAVAEDCGDWAALIW